MYGGRENLHILLEQERTCISLSNRYKFSPTLHRQHIYYLVSMRLKYHYEFMGWDGLLLLNILHNNQLKELGDISNNAIVNMPVHVFQGLIFLKEVNWKLIHMSFTSNKLQDNAESSDTFINKPVLTVASYTRPIYYKYNRIPVFYHLPFAFMETN